LKQKMDESPLFPAIVEAALGPLDDGFRLAQSPAERLEIIQAAVRTAISILRHPVGVPEVFAPLDELLFALEKLATKPEEVIAAFLARDDKKPTLRPAQELRAHLVLAYAIFRAVQPSISERQAALEASRLYASFGKRGISSIRDWWTNIDHDPAGPLYQELKLEAERIGLFGISFARARIEVGKIAAEAESRLGVAPV
jgi:hypothetical protein